MGCSFLFRKIKVISSYSYLNYKDSMCPKIPLSDKTKFHCKELDLCTQILTKRKLM